MNKRCWFLIASYVISVLLFQNNTFSLTNRNLLSVLLSVIFPYQFDLLLCIVCTLWRHRWHCLWPVQWEALWPLSNHVNRLYTNIETISRLSLISLLIFSYLHKLTKTFHGARAPGCHNHRLFLLSWEIPPSLSSEPYPPTWGRFVSSSSPLMPS